MFRESYELFSWHIAYVCKGNVDNVHSIYISREFVAYKHFPERVVLLIRPWKIHLFVVNVIEMFNVRKPGSLRFLNIIYKVTHIHLKTKH